MDNKTEIYDKIVTFLKDYGVINISVFGSYANNEETEKSDIDLIVEFKNQLSLLKYVEIEQGLSDYLGIKVDLLTKASISPYIYNSIQSEIKVIYRWVS
ncbi:MAG: nucleotidyltransferase family protein [Ignavibacteria bacterium]